MARVATKKELPELPVTGKTLAELAKQLFGAMKKSKEFEAKMDQQKSLIHRLATQVMPPLMEAEDTDAKSIIGVGVLEYGIEVYPHVKKDDIPAWLNWLRESGHGALITEGVHPKTQQAFVKEQLSQNAKLPEIVNVAKIPTVVLKAPKKK